MLFVWKILVQKCLILLVNQAVMFDSSKNYQYCIEMIGSCIEIFNSFIDMFSSCI